jgi:uncharacterized membrane protein YuzA (DUF378 family)
MFSAKCNCKWGGCITSKVVKILVIIGGVNWGLVGAGMLAGNEWNVVHLVLSSMPTLEAVVYVLVGVAAVMKIFSCRCKKCTEACASCSCSAENKTEENM